MMLTDREEKIVAWLRREARLPENDHFESRACLRLADAISRGEHLKRPEPTIPFEKWKDVPSVG